MPVCKVMLPGDSVIGCACDCDCDRLLEPGDPYASMPIGMVEDIPMVEIVCWPCANGQCPQEIPAGRDPSGSGAGDPLSADTEPPDGEEVGNQPGVSSHEQGSHE